MNTENQTNQTIEALLLPLISETFFEFGYMKLDEEDLQDVASGLELTPEEINFLEGCGSNFILIQTLEGSFCTASSWDSWAQQPHSYFGGHLLSVRESELLEVRENKPFQICVDNQWVGTLPYSEQLVRKLNRFGMTRSIIEGSEERCINYFTGPIVERVKNGVCEVLSACNKVQ